MFSEVRVEVERWLSLRAAERAGQAVQVPQNGKHSLPGGAEIDIESRGNPQRTAIWRATYAHPHDQIPHLRWHMQCQLVVFGGVVEFNLRLAAGEAAFRVTPARLQPGRPRVVPIIIKKFTCSAGGRVLESTATTLEAKDVETFVDKELLDLDRALPVIVISPVSRSSEYLIDPERLADALAGLASVRSLKDDEATYALSDALPPRLSTYNGAVRVYWPRMQPTDSPFLHPLYPPEKIVRMREGNHDPGWVISQRVYAASAVVHHESRLAQHARAALVEEWAREHKDAVARSRTAEELRGQVDGLLAIITEKDSLLKAVQEENEELHRSFFDFQRQLLEDARAEEGQAGLEEVPVFRAVEEALSFAAKKFPLALDVWGSALESAQKSVSKHTLRVYDTLRILAHVTQEYFEAKAKGKGVGMTLEKRFKELGAPKYAAKDSETTTSMYGDKRRFTEEDRSFRFEKHFTLGINSRDNCVQVYFHLDENSKRAIVGYCGPHLPHADGTR